MTEPNKIQPTEAELRAAGELLGEYSQLDNWVDRMTEFAEIIAKHTRADGHDAAWWKNQSKMEVEGMIIRFSKWYWDGGGRMFFLPVYGIVAICSGWFCTDFWHAVAIGLFGPVVISGTTLIVWAYIVLQRKP